MGNLLARVKINIRIYMLIAIAALGIGAVVLVSSGEIRKSMTMEREEQTRRLVETAASMVDGFYKESLVSGGPNEEESKRMALRA